MNLIYQSLNLEIAYYIVSLRSSLPRIRDHRFVGDETPTTSRSLSLLDKLFLLNGSSSADIPLLHVSPDPSLKVFEIVLRVNQGVSVFGDANPRIVVESFRPSFHA